MIIQPLFVLLLAFQAQTPGPRNVVPPPPVSSCTGAVTGDLTPGALTLTATLQSISVTAPYTDSNEDGTVVVTFQKHVGDSSHTAYAPYVDRRSTIGGVTNTYKDQARGAIVGLVKNTSYDVKATWTEGAGAPSCVSGTVSTMTDAPPTGSGTSRSITDNTTQASALAAANPGDTLTWSTGSYNAFTLSRSGNSGAWITLDGGGVATINGSGVNQNIALAANYVILKNFILSASDFYGIDTSVNGHNQIISNNTVQGFSTLCIDGPATTHYGDAGIGLGGSNSNILVQSNTITGSTNLTACVQSPVWSGPGEGISFTDCTTCVFDSNTIVCNGCRDALTGDDSSEALVNVDISNNSVSGYLDDGIEFKGQNRNARAWGNIVTENGNSGSTGDTCWSNENTNPGSIGTMYGPSYYFRNTCYVTATAGSEYKGPSGPVYIFHNSTNVPSGFSSAPMYGVTSGCGPGNCGWPIGFGPFFVLNNATVVGEMSEYGGQAQDDSGAQPTLYDYSCAVTTGGYWAWHFLGSSATDYATFASFRSGQPSQDVHTVNSNPTFVSASDLHLQATSPCIDMGLLLNNFNTADSAWPYLGVKPDAGAYEKQ